MVSLTHVEARSDFKNEKTSTKREKGYRREGFSLKLSLILDWEEEADICFKRHNLSPQRLEKKNASHQAGHPRQHLAFRNTLPIYPTCAQSTSHVLCFTEPHYLTNTNGSGVSENAVCSTGDRGRLMHRHSKQLNCKSYHPTVRYTTPIAKVPRLSTAINIIRWQPSLSEQVTVLRSSPARQDTDWTKQDLKPKPSRALKLSHQLQIIEVRVSLLPKAWIPS